MLRLLEVKRSLMAMLGVLTLLPFLSVAPASAGRIVLTGHDDDYHYYYGDANAGAQLKAMIAYVSNGSVLPVLTFDAGVELTTSLTKLGISYVNINPNVAISSSVFDPTKYSAMAVASDFRCGGCDNNSTSSTNLAADSAAIATFFNAGGGIVGLSGASNSSYYSFLPNSASGFGSPPSSGYVQTADGASVSIPAVNGDPTHNFFFQPGTGGVDAAYRVAEVYRGTYGGVTDPAETIFLDGKICIDPTTGLTCGFVPPGTGVPEPSSLFLLGSGLIGLAIWSRKRVVLS